MRGRVSHWDQQGGVFSHKNFIFVLLGEVSFAYHPPLRLLEICGMTQRETGLTASLKWRATDDFSSFFLLALLCLVIWFLKGLMVLPTYWRRRGHACDLSWRADKAVSEAVLLTCWAFAAWEEAGHLLLWAGLMLDAGAIQTISDGAVSQQGGKQQGKFFKARRRVTGFVPIGPCGALIQGCTLPSGKTPQGIKHLRNNPERLDDQAPS